MDKQWNAFVCSIKSPIKLKLSTVENFSNSGAVLQFSVGTWENIKMLVELGAKFTILNEVQTEFINQWSVMLVKHLKRR